jgi:hypothetical protein
MKKIFDIFALLELAMLFCLTGLALWGPNAITGPIPTHFDSSGHANAWGKPANLLFLPLITSFLYGLLTTVARFPAIFNYPVVVTPENRPKLEALTLLLLSVMKAELIAVFLWLQYAGIQSARDSRGHLFVAFTSVCLLLIFGSLVGFFVALVRAAK